MYYVFRGNAALANTYLFVSEVPDGLDHDAFVEGQSMSKPPRLVTLIGDDDSPGTLSDVVLTQFQLPVLSPTAVEVLESAGVDNIQYFPISIKAPNVRAAIKDYKIANIVGLIDCLDRKNATIRTFASDPTAIRWLQKYRLLEDRIRGQGPGKKPPLVFRLGEFSYHVLVHESIKNAFEAQGLTGAEFIPPEEFA